MRIVFFFLFLFFGESFSARPGPCSKAVFVHWLGHYSQNTCCSVFFFFPSCWGFFSARGDDERYAGEEDIYVHTHTYMYQEDYASEEREGEEKRGREKRTPLSFSAPSSLSLSSPLTLLLSLALPLSHVPPPNALPLSHVLTRTPRFSPIVSPPSLLTPTVCKRKWVRRVWECGGVGVWGWTECASSLPILFFVLVCGKFSARQQEKERKRRHLGFKW